MQEILTQRQQVAIPEGWQRIRKMDSKTYHRMWDAAQSGQIPCIRVKRAGAARGSLYFPPEVIKRFVEQKNAQQAPVAGSNVTEAGFTPVVPLNKPSGLDLLAESVAVNRELLSTMRELLNVWKPAS